MCRHCEDPEWEDTEEDLDRLGIRDPGALRVTIGGYADVAHKRSKRKQRKGLLALFRT